jgi:hypothetical protein
MEKRLIFIRKKPGFWAGFFILLLYVALHFLTLYRYPFVHSDEAWLAGLSRSMADTKSLASTEDFFKLTPRYPHAIKSAFHLLQIPFLEISYSPLMARLPGLFAGFGILYLLVKIAKTFRLAGGTKYLPAVLLGLDSQFWYCSHFARQEILLVFLMLLATLLSLRENKRILSALPLVLGFFIHPNGAIIVLPVVFIHLFHLLSSRKKGNQISCGKPLQSQAITLLYFVLIVVAGAIAVVGFSLLMDPDFILHYRRFGESVGVTDSILVKALRLPRFYSKMLKQIAGTYYLPPVQFSFLIFLLSFPVSAILGWKRRASEPNTGSLLFLLFLCINLGYIAIGKYSPPGLIFIYPFGYLAFGVMTHNLLRSSEKKHGLKYLLIAAVVAVVTSSGVITFTEIYREMSRDSYADLTELVKKEVPEEGIVLANLNTGFMFNSGRIIPWRDLEYLRQEQLGDWLKLQGVEWVITSDELDLVYGKRPVWKNLYGNLSWYPALHTLLQEKGELVSEKVSPIYGMRIIPLQDTYASSIRIYYLRW